MVTTTNTPEDLVVAVTGGASGIGAAVVAEFCQRSASVIILDQDRDAADTVCEAQAPSAGTAVAVAVDVSEPDAVKMAMAGIADRYGRLDALVTSAGILATGRADQMTVQEWDRMMDVNVKGSWLCAKYAFPLLCESPAAAIVLVASVHAFASRTGYAAYSTSKAGVVGLTLGLANDFAPFGIRVNAAVPAGVETPLTTGAFEAQGIGRDEWDRFTTSYLLRRFARPEEVASVIVFLATGASSFVTGSAVTVDGGLLAGL